MGKYFGTDGIRGIFGKGLTEELSYLTGLAIGRYFGGDCVVGSDTRESGEAVKSALTEGLLFAGVNALDAGIVPTPAVSQLTKSMCAACGVMITASHNPPEYNGIKVFGRGGIKLNAQQEESLEYYIDNRLQQANGEGKRYILEGAAEQYIEKLTGFRQKLDGVRVWLDCGFGASAGIAAEVFSRLGASVVTLNDARSGKKINVNCGALYVDNLKNIMAAAEDRYIQDTPFKHSDTFCEGTAGQDFKGGHNGAGLPPAHREALGFAFDGDADRMAMVYDGHVLDGDSVLYSLSRTCRLKDNVVVGTVMSNLALEHRLIAENKRLLRTKVGDKHILDLMLRHDYNLGGEQSGHYIFYPDCATGDGILAAIKMSAAYLSGDICRLDLFPQKTVSLPLRPESMYDRRLVGLIKESEKRVGRIVVRLSGTEPKVRIMAEDENEELIDGTLKKFEDIITEINKTGGESK